MAEMTIMLRRDPQTGKQNIIIKLDSDPDALPHEHEQMHRRLVEKVIGRGLVAEDEVGELIIEREASEKVPETPQAAPAREERRAQGQGQ